MVVMQPWAYIPNRADSTFSCHPSVFPAAVQNETVSTGQQTIPPGIGYWPTSQKSQIRLSPQNKKMGACNPSYSTGDAALNRSIWNCHFLTTRSSRHSELISMFWTNADGSNATILQPVQPFEPNDPRPPAIRTLPLQGMPHRAADLLPQVHSPRFFPTGLSVLKPSPLKQYPMEPCCVHRPAKPSVTPTVNDSSSICVHRAVVRNSTGNATSVMSIFS